MATTHDRQSLTPGELCARWGIDIKTLDKLVQVGRLGYILHHPRLRRFPLEEVEAYERKNFRRHESSS